MNIILLARWRMYGGQLRNQSGNMKTCKKTALINSLKLSQPRSGSHWGHEPGKKKKQTKGIIKKIKTFNYFA